MSMPKRRPQPPAEPQANGSPSEAAAEPQGPAQTNGESRRLPENEVDTKAALALLLGAVGRDLARLGRSSLAFLRARRPRRSAVTTGPGSGADADAPPARQIELELPSGAERGRRRRRVLVVASTLAAGFIVAIVALMVWALHDVPLEEIASGRVDNQVISLVAAGGEPLIQRGPYREASATLDQFPESLVEAVLAIEDRRFYEHWGMDMWGIGRALTRNFFAGEIREGGSTITQQLLKILYLEPDRALRRKVQELFLSLWLESRMSKDEILTLYLNNVYLGAGATGMPAAARVYFDKSVGELTVAESALLAGLIASPTALNPLENLKGARERASAVLRAMQSAGFLDDAAAVEAQLNSAELQPRRPQLGTGTWFADWAMQDAQEISGQFLGNVRVTTTLVPALQTIAEQSVRTVMAKQGASSQAGQAAMVVLGPDGAVLAMVGGLDYGESQFNRALALRQPGSTFKLFTYYAALKLGAAPNTRLEDRPIEIDGWSPENFDGGYSGRVSLAEAFARSLNVATVYLGMEVGLPNIVSAARELGIDASLREMPSLILGASEVSLLDLTGAYASVRAGIAPIEPYAIATFEAANGRPFAIGPSVKPSQQLGETRDIMVDLLRLVVERGTGQAALLDRFAAGKTGTSQDYRDAWFIGFDENYTVGVWVGNDDSSPMDNVTGGRLPAMIWQRFMIDAVPPQRSAAEAAVGIENQQTNAPLQCNIQACSRAYRSFRASDCTFQPYSGPRRICEK